MRYTLEVDLDVPRARVIELFLDSDNLSKWQRGLVSFEHMSGEPREVGAKSLQIHMMGKRETEMVETIMTPNPPYEYAATYESDGVWNLIENRFIEVDENKTQWILYNDLECSGIMKVMAFFLPGMFKKQTLTFMNMFKEFAENSGE